MTPTIRSLRCLMFPFLSVAPPAHADTAACQPIMASMVRMTQTPNHQFTTYAFAGGAPTKSEVVITGKTLSILDKGGQWRTVPYDAQQQVAELNRKFADPSAAAKVSCTRMGSEAVGGERATLYAMHDVTQTDVVDVQVWISDANGLPLRQVIDMPGVKSRVEARFDYANVQAPAAH